MEIKRFLIFCSLIPGLSGNCGYNLDCYKCMEKGCVYGVTMNYEKACLGKGDKASFAFDVKDDCETFEAEFESLEFMEIPVTQGEEAEAPSAPTLFSVFSSATETIASNTSNRGELADTPYANKDNDSYSKNSSSDSIIVDHEHTIAVNFSQTHNLNLSSIDIVLNKDNAGSTLSRAIVLSILPTDNPSSRVNIKERVFNPKQPAHPFLFEDEFVKEMTKDPFQCPYNETEPYHAKVARSLCRSYAYLEAFNRRSKDPLLNFWNLHSPVANWNPRVCHFLAFRRKCKDH